MLAHYRKQVCCGWQKECWLAGSGWLQQEHFSGWRGAGFWLAELSGWLACLAVWRAPWAGWISWMLAACEFGLLHVLGF